MDEKRVEFDEKTMEHIRRSVEAAPPIPEDALELLRDMGCPTLVRRRGSVGGGDCLS